MSTAYLIIIHILAILGIAALTVMVSEVYSRRKAATEADETVPIGEQETETQETIRRRYAEF